jgi:leucyl aminopeptidase (aminopeptidase T)
MPFNLRSLLITVFDPQGGETVLVACDIPHAGVADTPQWRDRRDMALEWREAFESLGRERGFETRPLLTYAATGANGADLPAKAIQSGAEVALDHVLHQCTLAAFLTEFSATAALDGFCKKKEDFRAASMPGLERRMEKSALAADYREVARRCDILAQLLEGAESLEVRFSTGHACKFDLRFRKAEVDDGFLPRFKKGDRIINLPSGETFIVPYEGEKVGEISRTAGELPVIVNGELLVLRVEGNKIIHVEGNGEEAQRLREYFGADPARANIAEVAFGCNEQAVVTGNVLEDEKAGYHWAYGRSDHLGGTVGVHAFRKPENVVHQDIVYAKGNPIQVAEATVASAMGRNFVIRDGAYVVF